MQMLINFCNLYKGHTSIIKVQWYLLHRGSNFTVHVLHVYMSKYILLGGILGELPPRLLRFFLACAIEAAKSPPPMDTPPPPPLLLLLPDDVGGGTLL